MEAIVTPASKSITGIAALLRSGHRVATAMCDSDGDSGMTAFVRDNRQHWSTNPPQRILPTPAGR